MSHCSSVLRCGHLFLREDESAKFCTSRGVGQVAVPTRRSRSKCLQKFRNFGCENHYNIYIYIYISDLTGILFGERCPGSYEVTEIGVKNALKFRNLRGLDWSQKVPPNRFRINFDRIRTNQVALSSALRRTFRLQWRPLLQIKLKRHVIPISCLSTRPLILAIWLISFNNYFSWTISSFMPHSFPFYYNILNQIYKHLRFRYASKEMSVFVSILAVLWFATIANSFIYKQCDYRKNKFSYKNLTDVFVLDGHCSNLVMNV